MCGPELTDPDIESEVQFLFKCQAYATERAKWLKNMQLPSEFDLSSCTGKLKVVLEKPKNIKPTAIFIANALSHRLNILNSR